MPYLTTALAAVFLLSLAPFFHSLLKHIKNLEALGGKVRTSSSSEAGPIPKITCSPAQIWIAQLPHFGMHVFLSVVDLYKPTGPGSRLSHISDAVITVSWMPSYYKQVEAGF